MTSKPKTKKRVAVAEFPKGAEPEIAQASAKLMLSPSANAAAVAAEYLQSPFGEQDVRALFDTLAASVNDVLDGETKQIEAMLFAQATALQTIFTSLARRANKREYLREMETFLRLALKAQTQCRATLETLATIKAGPAIFARQANIAHGPQQVNNGVSGPERPDARAEENESPKTELLDSSNTEPAIPGLDRAHCLVDNERSW